MRATRSILLVDDDPDELALIARALRRSGMVAEIVTAFDGMEAIELLFGAEDPLRDPDGSGEPIALPSIVFLDLQMPRCSGQEVLRRIRADLRTRDLPVVILTHSDEKLSEVESWRLGANGFVHKSDSFGGLVESFRELRAAGLRWLIDEGRQPPARDRHDRPA